MALRTSLLITGDSSGAKKAVEDLDRSVDKLAAGTKAAAAPVAELERAGAALATSSRAIASASSDAAGAHRVFAVATDAGAAAANRAAAAQRSAAGAMSTGAADAQRHAMGVRNLGQQFGDLAVMIQGGIDPARAFATQAGQMGYAMSEMGGKARAVGKFLVGPWGIALTVATTVLAPFVQQLFATDDAADAAQKGTEELAASVSNIGTFFDQATGKIRETNAALVQYAILTRQQKVDELRGRQAAAKEAGTAALVEAGRATRPTYAERGLGSMLPRQGVNFDVRSILESGQNVDARLRQLAESESSNAAQARTILQQRAEFAQAGREIERQRAEIRSFQTGALDSSLRTGTPRVRSTPAPKQPPAANGSLAEFGRETGARIASIVAQFDGTPSVLRQVNAHVAQLDDMIEALGRRKPPGFDKLIADARVARTVVQDGINRPYDDFVKAQQEQLDVMRMIAAGREDEAEALRTIQRLEASSAALTPERRDAVLATVQALRAEGREIERNRQRLQPYVDALSSVAGIVDDATQAFVRGDLGAIVRSPGKLLDAFQTLKGRQLFDQVFGDLFQQLQDEVSGTRIVEDASERMAGAVDQVAARTRATTGALGQLEAAARGAAGAVAGTPAAGGSAAFGGAAVSGAGSIGAIGLMIARGELAPDIVVNGRRRQDPTKLFADAIGGIGKQVAGVFTDDVTAAKIGSSIGKTAGRGLEGAAAGAFAATAAGALGIKLDRGGASIGGAIGGLTGLPGGGIVGGLLGGLVGGIFAPKARPGGATVSNVGGEAGYAGAAGSDKAAIQAGKDLAGSVAGSINQIVEQLGGTLGQFSVQIGSYKDDLRVNVNGRPLGGVKGSGASGFGEDANAAVNFAVSQAIAQGAVTGVSDAVARALRSSTSVEAALKEALTVQNVETLMGGIGGQIERAFRDFEATAKERVRVATAYGFDVVAIEKRNAADRLKIGEDLLRGQVGSLQALVDEMTRGSLFEGSALDKVAKLNEAIAKTKVDLNAGVEGAGDVLAGLYEQLNGALKASYGTTGGYAAGREQILDDARAAIAKANAQITAAQAKVSDPALATTNRALDVANRTLDEMADQNARVLRSLEDGNALLQTIAAQQDRDSLWGGKTLKELVRV